MSDYSKKVLIVEDDMIISMVLERMVTKLGYTVLDTVSSGEEAVRRARETPPDLILMDVQLKSELDGIDAMNKISEYSQVPVIYITGNSDQYNRERAQKTNFIKYMIKPIKTEDLIKAIENALKLP